MYKIFIIEDDVTIAESIKRHMDAWGMDARCISDFRNVIAELEDYEPHLVLMDIILPYYDGYHWCSEIRKNSDVPVLFLSSASDNMNIIMAMNMGGDDFIAKPFDLNVLTAKVQALLRRTYDMTVQSSDPECSGAVLNIANASLIYNDQAIDLTKNEYRILLTLMESKGAIVSRDTLMEKLWETDSFVDENTLTVNIARLRKKLESAGLENFIHTKKGMGYIVEEPQM